MKILHVVPSLSPDRGGTTTAVLGMADSLKNSGLSVTVATTVVDGEPRMNGAEAHADKLAFICNRNAKWRYSSGLRNFLHGHIRDFDVVHLHGLWQYPQFIATRYAYQYRIPTVISPHGMLNDWAVHHRRLRKLVYYRLVEKRNIDRASYIHVITDTEREAVLRSAPASRIVLIPNGIDVAGVEAALKNVELTALQPERLILFLGRIHPVKAIEDLITAFHGARLGPDWRLIIAGPVEVPAYMRRLRQLATGYGLDNQVAFVGAVYGTDKWQLLRRAWVTVVPSHSEVMGMVNLESGACRTPSISSSHAGLRAWEQGGGLVFEPDSSAMSLIAELRRAGGWSLEERISRGEMSREHVTRNYDTQVLVGEWRMLYVQMVKEKIN